MIKGLLIFFLGVIFGIMVTIVFIVAAILSLRKDRENREPTKDEWRAGL